MSDTDRRETARKDLRTLAAKLLDESRRLGDADAVAAAEKVHEHAHADVPDHETVAEQLRNLESKIALSPTVRAIVQALSNVGL